MLTKNFKNMIFCYGSYTDIVATNGTVTNNQTNESASYLFGTKGTSTSVTNSSGKLYCLLGNGQTTETDRDFELESPITTLTCNSFAVAKNGLYDTTTFGNEYIQYVAVFQNNTEDDILVSEIGIYCPLYSSTKALIYRKTFDPITFKPGETRTFTITLS